MKPFHLLLVASLFCAACGDPATSAGAPPHATAPSPKAQVPAAAAVVPEPVAPRELPMDSGPGVGPIPAPAGEAGPAAG